MAIEGVVQAGKTSVEKYTIARKPGVQCFADAKFFISLDSFTMIIGSMKFQSVSWNADVPSFANSCRNKMA